MTTAKLSKELRTMYDNAGKKEEEAVSIHLFGIKYADQIKDSDVAVKDIVRAAGLPGSY